MYGSDDEREQAKEAFAEYADKVMKASYPDFRIKLPCCGEGCEAKVPREVVSEVNLQVRFLASVFEHVSPLTSPNLDRRYGTPVIRTNVSKSTERFSSAKIARSRSYSQRRRS